MVCSTLLKNISETQKLFFVVSGPGMYFVLRDKWFYQPIACI